MSEAGVSLKSCPACGQRFRIELVRVRPEDQRTETYDTMRGTAVWSSSLTGAIYPEATGHGQPATLSVALFRYTYRCRSCRHEWSETHT